MKNTKNRLKVVDGTVHVLSYHHRHGTDIVVGTNKDALNREAVAIILDWISEIFEKGEYDVAENILSNIAGGNFNKAINLWAEYQNEHGDESMEFEKFSVFKPIHQPRNMLKSAAMEELKRLRAEKKEEEKYQEERRVEEENDREVILVDTSPEVRTCSVENCGNIAVKDDGTCGNHPTAEGSSFEETGEK